MSNIVKKVKVLAVILAVGVLVTGNLYAAPVQKTAINETKYANAEAFVKRLYTFCLDREAELRGLEYWTTGLYSGKQTGKSVVRGVFDSKEFKSKALTDEEYIELLYRVCCGRHSEDAGKAFWLKQLQSSTRADVLEGFLSTNEFKVLCSQYGVEVGK